MFCRKFLVEFSQLDGRDEAECFGAGFFTPRQRRVKHDEGDFVVKAWTNLKMTISFAKYYSELFCFYKKSFLIGLGSFQIDIKLSYLFYHIFKPFCHLLNLKLEL